VCALVIGLVVSALSGAVFGYGAPALR